MFQLASDLEFRHVISYSAQNKNSINYFQHIKLNIIKTNLYFIFGIQYHKNKCSKWVFMPLLEL